MAIWKPSLAIFALALMVGCNNRHSDAKSPASLGSAQPSTSTFSFTDPTVAAAIPVCEREVLKRLKAPTTAHFANMKSRYAETLDDQTYIKVTGKVDAENSFGAEVRSSVLCQEVPTGNKSYKTYQVSVDAD